MKAKLLKRLRKEARKTIVVIECYGSIWVCRKNGYIMDDLYPIVREGEKPKLWWSNFKEVERDLPTFRREYIQGRIRQMRLQKELKIKKQEGRL